MIDWLIFAEKKDQANKISDAIFDLGKPSGSFNKGGYGGSNLSSILDGEVRIVHFKGHIYQMELPNNQDNKYALATEKKKNRFGMVITNGERRSIDEVWPNYPIELNLDRIKWKLSEGNSNKIMTKNMKDLYKKSQNIIVSTDFDNEGEMIFRNWLNINIKNPKWNTLYRVKMNSTTPKEIRSAFSNLISYSNNNKKLTAMHAQGFARSIADYEYGLSFTFYGWVLAKNKGLHKGQYGRLKNSLLGVVHQAEIKHDQFKPSSRYRIDMVLPNGDVLEGDDTLIFDTKELANNYIKQSNLPKRARVEYSEKKEQELPPKLYSRNELLKVLMKKHDKMLSKGETWNTPLQTLYEQKSLITYPRTDVQFISLEIYKTLQSLAQTPTVQQLLKQQIDKNVEKHNLPIDIKFDVNKEPNKKHVDESKLDGESHYALVPTDKEPTEFKNLKETEKVVYLEDLIHTMTIFCNPTITKIRHYKSIEIFMATQNLVEQQGFRLLNGNIKKNKGLFPEAGEYDVTYQISEVKAKKPPLFTKMSLVGLTKRVNWGTSSTRDATIEELINKESLIMDGKYLRINPHLSSTIAKLIDEKLIDFEMTSEWQNQLDKLSNITDAYEFIESTRINTKEVHNTFNRMLNEV
ncbi:DNA topoisomerase [Staphylococcus hyicus]|uniref:DNA topoisomerase n=1 Tax=Staphylococcus hyicus TaxID=1284 RepID=UPI0031331EC3